MCELFDVSRRSSRALDDRFHESGTELEVCSWIPRFEIVRTRIGIMATWRHAVELAMDRGGNWHVERSFAVAERAGEPGIAGGDAARLPREPVVLCRGTKTWRPSTAGPALRRSGSGLRPTGGDWRPAATG